MSVVHAATGALVALCTPGEARTLTDRIKVGVDATWHLIKESYEVRAWAALGYASWDDYCTREFGTSRLRLPREERQEVVASLRESGLSTRAIAAATGFDQKTVRNDLGSGEDNSSPEPVDEPGPVTGTDGKTYKANGSPKPRRSSLTDAAEQAGWKFRKAVESLEAIAADDRFAANKQQVAAYLRGHLSYAIEVCQDLVAQLDQSKGD